MPKQGDKNPEVKLQKENANKNADNSTIRNVIGGVLIALGAIPPIYMVFYGHNIIVWIAFIASLFIVTGLTLFAYGTIKSRILIPVSSFIILILLYLSISLQTNEPEQPNIQPHSTVPSKDTLTIKTDSTLKSKQRSIPPKSQTHSPYVGVNTLTIPPELIPNQEFHIEVEIKNFGDVPAIDLKSEIHLSIVSPSESKTIIPPNLLPELSPIELLPNQTVQVPTGLRADQVTQSLIKGVENRTVVMVIWGVFTYSDSYGKKFKKTFREEYNSRAKRFLFPKE